jgi:lysophospholipase L1-like esterase
VRFYQDVVALHPQAVQIMAGTNDVAGNTGASSPSDFKNNIRAMVDLARTNHIQVSNDGVHPNFDGYAAMRPIADAALRKALHAAL